MNSRRKRTRSPLSQAIHLFITAIICAAGAFLIPVHSLSCTNQGYSQVCIDYVFTYDGINGPTFKIILGVAAVLFIVAGLFYLHRHNKLLAAQKSGAAFLPLQSAQPIMPQQMGTYPPAQPMMPQQMGTYPPQNAYPGNYMADAQFQPPSHQGPQQ